MSKFPERHRPIPLPLQYSAEILRSDGDESKVYIDGKKSRIEQTVGGMTTIAIWRPDLGKSYRVERETQTYSTFPITPEMEALKSVDIEEDIEWEYIGTEALGSRTVDVFHEFTKGESRPDSRVYVDTETHIRWKTVTFNRDGKEVLSVETRNVKIGPPPASVFELPEGLREIRLGK